MTETFKTILEHKQNAITNIIQELKSELKGPTFTEWVLRKCSSPELVYLIALDVQIQTFLEDAQRIQRIIKDGEEGSSTLKDLLKKLGKLDDSKGGASFSW